MLSVQQFILGGGVPFYGRGEADGIFAKLDGSNVPTLPMGTNDNRPATTAFVDAASGNLRDAIVINGAAILTTSELGKYLRCGGSNYTVTLPLSTGLVPGSTILIQNSGNGSATTGPITLAVQGADLIDPGNGTITSVLLYGGDSAYLVKCEDGVWALTGGSAASQYSGVFQNPFWATPPQFDDSNKLATTAFATRLGLQYQYKSTTSALVMNATHVGAITLLSGTTNYNVTLPPLASLPNGATVTLVGGMTTGNYATIVPPDTTVLAKSNGGTLTPPTLGPGDTATFICTSAAQWRLVGGSICLRDSQSMKDPYWTTQPQFANDKSLATTEFVQRAVGNYRGAIVTNTNETLTADHCGCDIELYGSVSRTITLPLLSAVGGRSSIRFINLATVNMTVNCQGSDVFLTSPSTATMVLQPGDTAELHSFNGWVVMGGSMSLKNVNWTTPAQFDNSKLLATTEFIQRAAGNMRGVTTVTANMSLTAAHVGHRIEITNSGVTVTLPAANSVAIGSVILVTTASANVSLTVPAGGTVLALNNFAVSTPYAMAASGDVYLVSDGVTWRGHMGSECLRNSPLFLSGLGTNGYQKLPSGLILQWGKSGSTTGTVAVTFPMAFPNACVHISEHDVGSSGSTRRSVWHFRDLTSTNVNCNNQCTIDATTPSSPVFSASTAAQCAWFAIGY